MKINKRGKIWNKNQKKSKDAVGLGGSASR